uniref:beta-N-acetylhexosaminidase n=1 Tax=Wuchereria bancrofti TaxID=6293 RepID=A0A1I8EST3_WUCBA
MLYYLKIPSKSDQQFKAMNIISRSRWLRCRIWRFFTIRTFLIFIFCCIILEITLGLPSYKQEDDVHTEYPRDFDSKEVTHSPFKTVKDLQKLKWNEKPVQELVEKKDDRKSKLETIAPFKQPLASLQSVRMRNQDEAQNSTKASYDESFYANRIIHFDLKGAAPKISYLKEVLRLIKANGATGILLEWEDTFPFSGILAENRNSDAYTVEEVRNLLETAKSLKLDVIPLVPTFGHLEWILKVEKFRQYRQNDMFPQVICLADDDGVSVVLEAIRQVVQLHQSFGITYFHIGADEAFQFGECLKDRRWLKENKNKEKDHLAAMHLAKIANYIKTLIPNFTWNSLAAKFPIVWGSSAYKGANGPLSAFLDLKHYFRNNKSWITHRKAYGTLFRTFRGLIITGWQRYDHFAVLCELLPVALPSVVLNLLVAKAGDKFSTQSIIKAATAALNCTSRISLEYMHSFDSCNFPGVELFSVIHSLRNHIKVIKSEVFESHQVKGWLNRFNIHHGYTQLWYLLQMKSIIEMHISDMLNLTKMVQSLMQPIFRKNTIDEWLYEYTDPIIEQLRELLQHISELKMQRTFALELGGDC